MSATIPPAGTPKKTKYCQCCKKNSREMVWPRASYVIAVCPACDSNSEGGGPLNQRIAQKAIEAPNKEDTP